jgi:hypothetical protein
MFPPFTAYFDTRTRALSAGSSGAAALRASSGTGWRSIFRTSETKQRLETFLGHDADSSVFARGVYEEGFCVSRGVWQKIFLTTGSTIQ